MAVPNESVRVEEDWVLAGCFGKKEENESNEKSDEESNEKSQEEDEKVSEEEIEE
jgi:hypothetical protein